MKKQLAVSAAIVVLAIAAIVLFRFQSAEPVFAFTIDGLAVEREEFQMLARQNQSAVQRRYTTEQANAPGFWTEGDKAADPLGELVGLTVDQLVSYKTAALLAKDYGIEFDPSYSAMCKAMEEENAGRDQKLEGDGVVYGLQEFSAEEYYAYRYANLSVELEEAMKAETEFSEDQLRQVYEQNLSLFTYDVGVAILAAELSPETPRKTVEQILLRMGEQTDPAQLTQEFPEASFYQLEMNSLDTQEGRSGAYAARWEIASQMQEGELSGPFEAGGTQMLLRCLSRTESGVLPFETVRGTMESQLQTAAVQERIRERAERAEIACDEAQLRQAALEALGR